MQSIGSRAGDCRDPFLIRSQLQEFIEAESRQSTRHRRRAAARRLRQHGPDTEGHRQGSRHRYRYLVAISCKRRGFCPSCDARRMAESAELLVDKVFPEQPVRQWLLSVPFPLRFLLASRPEVIGRVLGIVYRCIATHLTKKAGLSRKTAQTGAVTVSMAQIKRGS